MSGDSGRGWAAGAKGQGGTHGKKGEGHELVPARSLCFDGLSREALPRGS